MNRLLWMGFLACTFGDLAFSLSPPGPPLCQEGTTVVEPDCEKWCRCVDGRYECTSLCPPQSQPLCRPDFALIVKEVPAGDPEHRCKCKMTLCVPRPRPIERVCRHEGQSYKEGQWFIDSRCRGYCRCRGNGWISCVSLCPPVGVRCLPGQEKVTYQQPMGNDGRCFCERQKCRDKTMGVEGF